MCAVEKVVCGMWVCFDPSVARLLGHDATPRPTCPVIIQQAEPLHCREREREYQAESKCSGPWLVHPGDNRGKYY